MSTDGTTKYKRKGQKPVQVRVTGALLPTDWAKYKTRYQKLALGFGLKVSSGAKKTAAKKKVVKKTVAKKK